jgi:hypothetical protein
MSLALGFPAGAASGEIFEPLNPEPSNPWMESEKMKFKKEYVILILIIAALSAYLFMRSFNRTHYQLPEISRLEPGKITKIEIANNGGSLVLEKKDNQWFLDPQGYLADANRVEDMLKVIEALNLTALVSDAKDYSRYDLDPEKRISVKAWLGDTLQRDFDIGKTASSFRHTFVKLGGDNRVFHASDNFRGKFEQTVDSLRDKNVLAFKTTDIQEVQITRDQESVKLVRSEVPAESAVSQQQKTDSTPSAAPKFEWQSSAGQKGDDQNINRLLSILSNLRCEQYINGRDKASFSVPLYSVGLKGAQDYRLNIFAKLKPDDKNHPAVSSANDYPFFLSDGQAQQIMINPETLLKKPETNQKPSGPSKAE